MLRNGIKRTKGNERMKKRSLIYILVVLVVAIGALTAVLISNGNASKEPNSSSQANNSPKNGSAQPADASPTTATEGAFECLPAKGDGPQTFECAWGLKADDGKVYELRTDDPNPLSSVAMGSRIRVTGTIIEVASDKYDIIGAIRIEKVEQL